VTPENCRKYYRFIKKLILKLDFMGLQLLGVKIARFLRTGTVKRTARAPFVRDDQFIMRNARLSSEKFGAHAPQV